MPHPVVHWELSAKDPARLGSFYREVFAWEVSDEQGYAYLDTCEPRGINGGIRRLDEGEDFVTIYIQVDDVAAAVREAVEQGGTEVAGPQEGDGGTAALIADPEGNLIGLLTADAAADAS